MRDAVFDGYITKRVLDRDIAEETGEYDAWVEIAVVSDMDSTLLRIAEWAAAAYGVAVDDFVAAAAEYRAVTIMRNAWGRWLVT